MSEKLEQTTPTNVEHPADAEERIVKQLCPAECRDLIERLSGPQYGDTSSYIGLTQLEPSTMNN